MISGGDRDAVEGLGLGLGFGFGDGRRREMVEFELEEGEACSYQNQQDHYTTVDPDVTFSYLVRPSSLICFYLLWCSEFHFVVSKL